MYSCFFGVIGIVKMLYVSQYRYLLIGRSVVGNTSCIGGYYS